GGGRAGRERQWKDARRGGMLPLLGRHTEIPVACRRGTNTTRRAFMARTPLHRRRFLKTALSAGAAVMAPQIIPSSALGRDGAVAPSERIVVGGIGIGNRGTYDLSCFLEQKDVQFAAVCD